MNVQVLVRTGVCCLVAAMLVVPAMGQDATFFIEDLDGNTEGAVDATGPNAMALEVFVAADPPITVWGYQFGAPCEGVRVEGTGHVHYVAGTLTVDTERPDFLFAECVYGGCPLFTTEDPGSCPGSPARLGVITGMSGDAVTVGPDVKLCGCPTGATCLVYDEGAPCVDDTDCVSALGAPYDGVCYHLEYAGSMTYECEVGSGGAFEIGSSGDTNLQDSDGTFHAFETQPYTLWCAECAVDPDCDDGNLCTNDFCGWSYGQCEHMPVSCDDGNPCTDDYCDPASGCVYGDPPPCDDGDPCTEDDRCVGGGCAGTPIDCWYLDDECNTGVCQEGICIAQPDHEGMWCDDGLVCTGPDTCQAGVCSGGPPTWPFGDVTAFGAECPPTPPSAERSGCGVLIGLPDLAYVVSAFAEGADWRTCFPNADLMSSDPEQPCGGDDVITLADLVGVLQAFAQEAECESPCPCP